MTAAALLSLAPPCLHAAGTRRPRPVEPYDVGKFAETDPATVLYEEAPGIKPETGRLRSLAAGPGDAVLVGAGSSIMVFDRAGKATNRFDLGSDVYCVAAGADGLLYVGFRTHVEVFALDGSRQAEWTGFGESAFITSIAVSSNSVFVADCASRLVWRLDKSGKLLGQINGKSAGNPNGFVIPSPYFDVAAGADDSVWIANPGRLQIQKFSAAGIPGRSWGRASMEADGFCGCCNPTHLAVGPGGIFVTGEKGIPRVKMYDSAGKFAGIVAGPESFVSGARVLDLAVDSQGRVLVLDSGADSVRVFVPKKVSDGTEK